MNPITRIRRSIERFRSKRWRRRVEKLSPDMSAGRLNQRLRYDVRWFRRPPVATAGQPMWQAAFNRFCLSDDARIDEWTTLLDRYLAAGATGATRNEALVEAAGRSVVDGRLGNNGTVREGTLADGTFIHPSGTRNFVRLALADPYKRHEVLNFALRNLYSSPELVEALVAEGAEPGSITLNEAAAEAYGNDKILKSLDLMLDAGGDVNGIQPYNWEHLPDWLKAKHGTIDRRDLAIVDPGDEKDFRLTFGYYLDQTPDFRAAVGEARRRAIPGRITAKILNARAICSLPMWVEVLVRLPASARPTEVERLIARGADITRAGIARHFPDDEKSKAVEEVFSALPCVKVYVEGEELRKVAEEATAAQVEPEQRYGRRRL